MVAQVFAVCNQKGGTGKTTLTMNLAAGLAKRARTLVIDADPQGSASQWANMASDTQPFPVSVFSIAGNLGREIQRLKSDYQYIVIDCPPTLENDVNQQVMLNSDYVLIPTLPSPIDLWASVSLVELLQKVRVRHSELKPRLIVNQLEPSSAISRAMQQALSEFDLPCLQQHISRRAIYRHAAMDGKSVYCLGKRALAAQKEINAIIEELL